MAALRSSSCRRLLFVGSLLRVPRRHLWSQNVYRAGETARVQVYLTDSITDRAFVMVGPEGSGKTSILHAAISRLQTANPNVVVFNYCANNDASDNGFDERLVTFELDVLRRLSVMHESGGPVFNYVEVYNLLSARHPSPKHALADFIKHLKDHADNRFRSSLLTPFLPADQLQSRLSNDHLEATSWLDLIKTIQRPLAPNLPLPELLLAYDLLCQVERRRSKGKRTGMLVLPFLLELMAHAATETAFQPKLILSGISAAVHTKKDMRESDLIDLLLLRFTNFSDKKEVNVPTLIDPSDSVYAFNINNELLLEYCNVTARIEYLQVFAFTRAQVELYFVPQLIPAEHLDLFYVLIGGLPANLASFFNTTNEKAAFEERIHEWTKAHNNKVADRIDKCVSLCQFDDGENDGVVLRFVDVLHRMRDVDYVINVETDAGKEFLFNNVVQIMINEGLLFMQLTPPYLRPCSHADKLGLGTWLQMQQRLMTWSTWAQYRLFRTFRGVGSLRHLTAVEPVELASPAANT